MLAWEWAKCQDETLDQEIRPIRRSLRTLFESPGAQYSVHHMTGAKLVKYMNVVKNLGLIQRYEDETGEIIVG